MLKRFALSMAITLVVVSLIFAISGCKPKPADKKPVAQFSATPLDGNEPLVVQFTDLSVSESSPIVSWYWDFGDGETSNLPNPIKTYYHNPKDANNPSFYTVTLKITTGIGIAEQRKENYIRVNPGTTFTIIDPNKTPYSGVVSGYGVTITVPQGALTEKTTFSIYETKEAKQINFYEPIELVSPFYRIAHDAKEENLFAKSGEKIVSSTLEIPLFNGEAERTERPANRYLIIALLEDGSMVPVLAEKRNNTAFARVTGLPHSAIYVVAFFPYASIIDVQIPLPEGEEPPEHPWNLNWRIFGSVPVIKQLVALDKGDMENPNTFYNENFSDEVAYNTLNEIAKRLGAVFVEYVLSGIRNPILVDHDGAYGLVFFNMNLQYTSEYEDFYQLSVANRQFGNIVIDPKQLLMVSIHNAIVALNDKENKDIKQKYTPYNIFSQYLFYSCFDNYKLPEVLMPDPTDIDALGSVRKVSYFKGLKESSAVYLGQHADRVVAEFNDSSKRVGKSEDNSVQTWARSFSESEFYDLTQTLFQPIAMNKKRYYNAGQEFWAYLEKKLSDTPTIGIIGVLIQELEKVFKNELKPQQTVTYELATLLSYKALDTIIYEATDDTERLSELYWYFVRGRALEKFDETILRVSDKEREIFVPNESQFLDTGIPERKCPAPTDKIFINPTYVSELQSILPLSSRIVKININPLSAKVQVILNPKAWTADDNGYSLKFAVYHPAKKKVYTLDANGIDTDKDGVLDTIPIQNFKPDEDVCFDYIYLLVSNVSLNKVNPVDATIDAKAPDTYPEDQILKKYVDICDPYYDYELIRTGTFPTVGLSSYVLKMTSGIWRGAQEVYNPEPWTHYVTIIEPPIVLHDKALLMVTGGSTDTEPDLTDVATMVFPFISATGTIAAVVKSVPNQPLEFVGETRKRSEDAIIAYSFDKYMDAYKARKGDITWPALLPMVRTAVRAMDTVQKFVKEEKPGNKYELNQFVITGASKRGWTSWLTSAIDPRICAVMPIVIDVLNMPLQIEHHYNSYGGKFSPALKDYVAMGIFDRLGTPEGDSLWKIVDPINYLDNLQMPKLIANSTGDQFFLPDSAKFYFNELKPNIKLGNNVIYPENSYLYYAPNTDHGLASGESLGVDEATYRALLAFYISVINNQERPKFFWWVEEDTSEPDVEKRAFRIRLDAITRPKEVLLWQATNKDARDFRLNTIGLGWTSEKLRPFCPECGGDPGYAPEAILEIPTSGEKSYPEENVNSIGGQGILGTMENNENQRWVYLEGTYYQMGYHYGRLLQNEVFEITSNINLSSLSAEEKQTLIHLASYMPSEWMDVIHGIADGAGINYEQLVWANMLQWDDGIKVTTNNNTILISSNTDNLIFSVWKPTQNNSTFVSLAPVGLFISSLIVNNDGEAIAITPNQQTEAEKWINKIQFTLNWIKSTYPITPTCNTNESTDLLYANRNNIYGITLKNSNIDCVGVNNDSVIANEETWSIKYIPSSGLITLSSTHEQEINVAKLLNAFNLSEGVDNLTVEQFKNNNIPLKITKLDSSNNLAKSSIVEEGETGGVDGEEEPACVCEFEENEIIPYVATVPVPKQGWTAFFIQVKFPGPAPYSPELKDLDYVFSTRVVIVPDIYPD